MNFIIQKQSSRNKAINKDLEKLFTRENHAYPPSLSIYDEMQWTDKSDTIKIFENLTETSSVKLDFTAEVIDGAAFEQAQVPKGSTKFW